MSNELLMFPPLMKTSLMQQLDVPLTCPECKRIYECLPEEDGETAPVHCTECGAFMCYWGYLKSVHVKSHRMG